MTATHDDAERRPYSEHEDAFSDLMSMIRETRRLLRDTRAAARALDGQIALMLSLLPSGTDLGTLTEQEAIDHLHAIHDPLRQARDVDLAVDRATIGAYIERINTFLRCALTERTRLADGEFYSKERPQS